MKPNYLSCVIFFTLLLLSGCATSSPEEAALRQLPTGLPTNIRQSYRVVAIKDSSTGKLVVLAPAVAPVDSSYPKIFYSFVNQTIFGWRIVTNGSVYVDSNADNTVIRGHRFVSAPLNNKSSSIENTGVDPFVMGWASDINDSVTAVEIGFDDGRTIRSEVASGVYVVINPNANTPCYATFFDKEHRVVQEVNWSESFGATVPHNCVREQ